MEFRYHRPATIADACALGLRLGTGAAFLAGGTELVPDYQRGRETASDLIALSGISGLRGIERERDALRIGCLTTVAEVARSPLVAQWLPALAEGARALGSPPIRNRATVGGNFCRAVSCADLPPAALIGDARLRIATPGGTREIAAADFFRAARRTVLGPGELLTDLVLPAPPANRGTRFERFSLRRGMALAVASVAARIDLDGDVIAGAALALGAVAPTPILAPAAAGMLVGEHPSASLFAGVAAACAAVALPLGDVRGSAGHRRELVDVLARRALERALARAAAGRSAS
jgi:CO/xanthine dehydrogenase FAD-binding subunit